VSDGKEVVRWSNSYDNQPTQRIPAIQAEVAQSVAQVFFPEGISAASQTRLAKISTNSPEAYTNLLKAQQIIRGPIVSSDLLQEAIRLFGEAISLDPNYIWAKAGLCTAYRLAYEERVGEFSAVQQACEELVGAGEGLYTVRLALGVYYKESGDLDRALTELNAATALNQQSADVRLELARLLEKRAVLNNDSLERLKAEQAFLEAIRIEPGYWYTYHLFASFLTQLGRLDEATVQYRKALEIVPNSVASLNNMAGVAFRQGNTDEAEQYWKKSLTISADNSWAYEGLGILFHYKRDFESAVKYFLLGTQYSADDHKLWGRLGESYQLIPGQSDKAIAVFKKAIDLASERAKINPSSWQTQGYLALYSAYVGNHDASARYLTRMMELNPTQDPLAHYWSALVAQQAGDDEEVFRQLELALEYGYSEQPRFIAEEPVLDTFIATYPKRFADLLARY
jgi:tetratricopeptide (TPR) repeat protein